MHDRTGISLLLASVALVVAAGCGSKISEANYYRVQNGMDEAAVDDLLGPAHRETIEAGAATSPAATRAEDRKIKTWSRGWLTLTVVFEGGRVVSRTAEGIPFEGSSVRPAATSAGHSSNTTPR